MKIFLHIVFLIFIATTVHAEEMSATEIMTRNYMVNRTRDRMNDLTIEIFTDSGKKRVRKFTKTAILLEDGVSEKRLIRFHYPPDVKGTGFLFLENSNGEDHMWFYQPSLRKSRRSLASDKKDRFLGTEFSNGDVSHPRVSEYSYVFKGEEEIAGVRCYVIEATPATDQILRDYGYSKRVDYIRKDSFTRQKALFYDLKGALLKTLTCFAPIEVDPVNHKWFIKRREMINHQNGNKTTLQIDRIRVNLGLDENAFTLRNLEKGS
jgi:outer membrane lipoprotein-sorting protein